MRAVAREHADQSSRPEPAQEFKNRPPETLQRGGSREVERRLPTRFCTEALLQVVEQPGQGSCPCANREQRVSDAVVAGCHGRLQNVRQPSGTHPAERSAEALHQGVLRLLVVRSCQRVDSARDGTDKFVIVTIRHRDLPDQTLAILT